MKRKLIVISAYTLLNVFFTFLALNYIIRLGIGAYFVINIVVSLALIFTANVIINYHEKSNIKSCAANALIMALIACAISLAALQFNGNNNAINNMISNSSETDIHQKIQDEVDRQAREKMLEEGIIDEDDVITRGPLVTDGDDSKVTGDYNELVVTVQSQDTLSTIVQVLFDALIAFFGGLLGRRMWRKRHEPK